MTRHETSARMAKSLKQWRESNGLTRRRVADALGVTLCSVYNWERGPDGHSPNGPHLAHLLAIHRLAPGLPEALGLK